MANVYAKKAGGNFSNADTWVNGIVPTAKDHVFLTATSEGLNHG